MSLKILVDMILSPDWIPLLVGAGYDAVHWSTIGHPRADDAAIMAWARSQNRIVLTHDLDFSRALALTGANGPSVIQVRGRNVLPEFMGPFVLAALNLYQSELAAGALVVVDSRRCRVKVLPF